MDPDFWIFFAVGAAAQLVDGALGMAYGVVSSTVLLALGVPPANASASVHAAKVFTGAASALSHIAYRNIGWKLLLHLSAGGVVGGVLGTYVLTSIDGKVIKPWVVAWLGVMGLVILWRAWKATRPRVLSWKRPLPLGFVGGFFDAVGGGGWGAGGTRTPMGSVGGLIAGGMLAAPLAGWMTKVLPVRALTWMVGLLVTGLAVWQGAVLAGL